MGSEKVQVLGVNVDKITMSDAIEKGLRFIEEGGFHAVFTPNPEIIWVAQRDEHLKDILCRADMVLPDGIGVVIASKILKNPVPERVPGFDFTCNLLEHGGFNVFLLGAKPGVAQEAAQNIKIKFPNTKIVGTAHGYFTQKDVPDIINKINKSGADVLLVCLGAPRQEKWIFDNKDKLKPSLCLGVGGTLDVLAGHVKRAPKIWQRLNLEWAYRLVHNPKRIGRMMVLPLFLIKVMFSKKLKRSK